MRARTLTGIVVCCLAVAGLTGCGSSSSSSSSAGAGATATTSSTSTSTHFAKTKFVLHAGLAFGAFHRYVYTPFKAGDFSHPLSHKLTLVKAGAAALFVEHELRLAAADVRSSKALSTLFSPLTGAADKIASLKDSITRGKVSGSDLDGVQSRLTSIGTAAKSKGQAIQETTPSSAQLAAGG